MEPDELKARFAKVLRRRRLLARLNQEELAEKAGLHRTHVSILERGRQVPSMTVVLKLANALGTTLTDLFRAVESGAEPATEPPAIPKGRPPSEGRPARPVRRSAKKPG